MLTFIKCLLYLGLGLSPLYVLTYLITMTIFEDSIIKNIHFIKKKT